MILVSGWPQAKLPPGQHALVVEGLTESVVEDSFRVNGGVGM